MKPKETFYFDEAKYKEDIADRYFSYTALAREIYNKRANRLSSNVRLGMSLVAVPFTGVSAVGTLMCGRNINVESRKLMLLEVEWARRGQTRLPERSWREKIVPVTITIGACTFMIGVDVALGSLLPSPDVFFQPTPPIDLDGLLISEFAPKAAQMVASQAAEFMTDKVGEGLEEGTCQCYYLPHICSSSQRR